MKKAFLVRFEPTTRVVVDVDFDSAKGIPDEVWDKVSEEARKKILGNPADYIILDNIGDLKEDTECPYSEMDKTVERYELRMELYDKISQRVDYDRVKIEDIEDVVRELDGFQGLETVDEKIDDGCDDDSGNTYVMMRSFDIDYKGETFYCRFFYGDGDRIIGSFDVD